MTRKLIIAATLALCSPALGGDKIDHQWDQWVREAAHAFTTSAVAVNCQLRTPEWRKSVTVGVFGSTRIGVMASNSKWNDQRITDEVVKILHAAITQAATDTQFAAPTASQCDTLKESSDMQDLDRAARIGLLVGPVQ